MNTVPDAPHMLDVERRRWRLDPARSSVEFEVPHFYGLVTVKGRFERYEGTLDLRSEPAVELTMRGRQPRHQARAPRQASALG